MVKLLKELFCKHNFVEKCKIDDFKKENGLDVTAKYIDVCFFKGIKQTL